MHPHLANEKQVHCGELIDQLQQCHQAGFMHKYMGGCNGIKEELNACLREERLIRTQKNREASKAQNEKKKAMWKDIDENR
ncbi:UPF0287-domain-containing protein [Meira miltonrushii]|uniref:COX assembly mitochondrial protein n=1 Tax=Meira miltonrushii TaxID=1280837 RepID=A0A316VER5_9BASI|nr:UPF0287-domain-containing protein [Meira miltonrushii]PWN35578.1 UPF0287-domain-containing protein [Meira miltonrushii]